MNLKLLDKPTTALSAEEEEDFGYESVHFEVIAKRTVVRRVPEYILYKDLIAEIQDQDDAPARLGGN